MEFFKEVCSPSIGVGLVLCILIWVSSEIFNMLISKEWQYHTSVMCLLPMAVAIGLCYTGTGTSLLSVTEGKDTETK